jgi:hypothetical protein
MPRQPRRRGHGHGRRRKHGHGRRREHGHGIRYIGPGTSHKLGAAPPRRQPACRSHVVGAAIGSGAKPVGHANGTPSRSAQPPKAMPLE